MLQPTGLTRAHRGVLSSTCSTALSPLRVAPCPNVEEERSQCFSGSLLFPYANAPLWGVCLIFFFYVFRWFMYLAWRLMGVADPADWRHVLLCYVSVLRMAVALPGPQSVAADTSVIL